MLRTRSRKILRDVFSRKSRLAFVSSAIFIGVVGTVALFSMGDILTRQLDEDIRVDQISMVNVLVSVNLLSQLDNAAYLERLEAIEGVTAVQGSTQGTAYFRRHDEDPYKEVNVLSYSTGLDGMTIEPLSVVEGEFPIDGARQVAVEARFAEKYGVELGDTLYFRIQADPVQQLTLGSRRPRAEAWRVVGMVFHPYVLSPANSIYTTPENNSRLTGLQGYSLFALRFTDYPLAHRMARQVADVISQETAYFPIFVQRQDPAQNPLTIGAKRLSSTMSTLALLALFVSGFLVVNVISSVVTEQRRQIGSMKAIGATQWDNIVIYCGIALLYGIIGVIPGVLVGVPLGDALAGSLASQVNVRLEGFQIAPRAIGIGVVAGLLVPLLSSIVPVLNGTRVSILEAITDAGITTRYRYGLMAWLIDRLPLPLVVKQALRNLSLKRIRIALTVFTLAVAVGALMAVLVVFNAVDRELRAFLDDFDADEIELPNFEDDPELWLSMVHRYLLHDEEVLDILDVGFQLPVQVEGYDGEQLIARGYDIAQSDFSVEVVEGEGLNARNAGYGVVLSQELAQRLGKGVGDSVTLRTLDNSASFTVVGVTAQPSQPITMAGQTLALMFIYDEYISTASIDRYSGGEVTVVGLDAPSGALLDYEAGTFNLENNAQSPIVVVSEPVAERGGYRVGDELVLRENGVEHRYTISGIFKVPPGADYLSDEVVGVYWQDLMTLEGRSFQDALPPPAHVIDTLVRNTAITDLDTLVSQLNERLMQLGVPSALYNFVGLLEAFSANLQTFKLVLGLVAMLIALVGALGLLSTLSMSVWERQREIGVMRSIGADSRIIASQFMAEGLVVGVLAWLLGLPLSYFMAQLIINATGMGDSLLIVYSLDVLLIGFGGVMVVTALASILPSYFAAQRTVSDILRYQ